MKDFDLLFFGVGFVKIEYLINLLIQIFWVQLEMIELCEMEKFIEQVFEVNVLFFNDIDFVDCLFCFGSIDFFEVFGQEFYIYLNY